MTKTAAMLAAALSDAWKANGASSALAAATTPRKAQTANTTARPLFPTVMDLEMEGWLMRILSEEHGARNHIQARGELIEIKLAGFPAIPIDGTSDSDINLLRAIPRALLRAPPAKSRSRDVAKMRHLIVSRARWPSMR